MSPHSSSDQRRAIRVVCDAPRRADRADGPLSSSSLGDGKACLLTRPPISGARSVLFATLASRGSPGVSPHSSSDQRRAIRVVCDAPRRADRADGPLSSSSLGDGKACLLTRSPISGARSVTRPLRYRRPGVDPGAVGSSRCRIHPRSFRRRSSRPRWGNAGRRSLPAR